MQYTLETNTQAPLSLVHSGLAKITKPEYTLKLTGVS